MKSILIFALIWIPHAALGSGWMKGYDGRIRLRCPATAYHSVRMPLPAEADPNSVAIFQAIDNVPVPFQFNDGELLFAAPRGSALDVYFVRKGAPRPARKPVAPLIEVEEGHEFQGQQSVWVRSAMAQWIYHAEGAGFASLLDSQGLDWISYRPGNRAAGEFRGIPNLGAFAHPGYAGDRGSRTTVVRRGPVMVRLRSESNDGKGALQWDIWPGYATLTVERTGEPFWFLYEGTPAGRLSLESAFWGTADGVRRPLTEAWNQDLPGLEWVYFGDTSVRRALVLVNRQDDRANDQFYQMDGSMTVWGFGRQHRCCGRYLTAPARFTVGFAESAGETGITFDEIRRAVQALAAEGKVEVGRVEWKPKN